MSRFSDEEVAAMVAEIERLQGELQSVHAHLQHYRTLVDGLRAALRAVTEKCAYGDTMCDALEIARDALEGK